MVTPENVRQIRRKYDLTSLWIVFASFLTGLLVVQVCGLQQMVDSLLFSALYSIVTSFIFGRCWAAIAHRSPNVLSRFYLAASALRMLLALVVVLVGAVVLRDDLTRMIGFVVIFAGFYLVLLIFDCVFFARVEKTKE